MDDILLSIHKSGFTKEHLKKIIFECHNTLKTRELNITIQHLEQRKRIDELMSQSLTEEQLTEKLKELGVENDGQIQMILELYKEMNKDRWTQLTPQQIYERLNSSPKAKELFFLIIQARFHPETEALMIQKLKNDIEKEDAQTLKTLIKLLRGDVTDDKLALLIERTKKILTI